MNVKNDPKMIIGENFEIGKNVIMTGNIRIGNMKVKSGIKN